MVKEEEMVVEGVATKRVRTERVFEIVQIKDESFEFPIVARTIPYVNVGYAFTLKDADSLFINMGNDVARTLYVKS